MMLSPLSSLQYLRFTGRCQHLLPQELHNYTPEQLEPLKQTTPPSVLSMGLFRLKRMVVRHWWAFQLRRAASNSQTLKQLANLMPGFNLPDKQQVPLGSACFSLGRATLERDITPTESTQPLASRLRQLADRLIDPADSLNKSERISIILARTVLQQPKQTDLNPSPVTAVVRRLEKAFNEGEKMMLPLKDAIGESPYQLVDQAQQIAGEVHFHADTGVEELGRKDLWDKVLQPPSEQLGPIGWFDESLKDVSYYVFCYNALLINQTNGAFAVIGFPPSVNEQVEQGVRKREATRSAQTFQDIPGLYPLVNMPGADGHCLFEPGHLMEFMPEAHREEYIHWQAERQRLFDTLNTAA